jgi:alpha-L-fucosidase
LYPTPHEKGAPESQEFLEDWLAKIKEVIDKYEPDYLWFDFGWNEPTFENYKKSFLAYYYNRAEDWDKEVVVTYKHDHLPKGTAVLDLERGKIDTLTDYSWITDTSVDYKSWCHISAPEYKSVNTLVDNLVDRVSKNGNLLLNIGPKADGTIPEEQRELLLGMGKWLELNGEAIYETRPWIIYGEGPTTGKGGAFSEGRDKLIYTAEDIRFTRKGNVLYAIALDWPNDQLKIKSLNNKTKISTKGIESISLMGSNGNLHWSREEDGLTVLLPSDKPCQHAYVLKINLNGKLILN